MFAPSTKSDTPEVLLRESGSPALSLSEGLSCSCFACLVVVPGVDPDIWLEVDARHDSSFTWFDCCGRAWCPSTYCQGCLEGLVLATSHVFVASGCWLGLFWWVWVVSPDWLGSYPEVCLIEPWGSGDQHRCLLFARGAGGRVDGVAETCILPGCEEHGTFDHIAWSCPCRPNSVEIPPKPGEFLSSRFGWVVSNSRVDMVAVQSWLVHVQMTVLSHVHSKWLLVVCAQLVRLAIGACPPGIVERGAFVRASFCLALWGCGCCNCASFGLAGAFCSGFLCLGLVEILGFCWAFCFLGVFAWAAAAAAAAAAALHLCAAYLGAAHITRKLHAHGSSLCRYTLVLGRKSPSSRLQKVQR